MKNVVSGSVSIPEELLGEEGADDIKSQESEHSGFQVAAKRTSLANHLFSTIKMSKFSMLDPFEEIFHKFTFQDLVLSIQDRKAKRMKKFASTRAIESS
jgi:hypothetical protein